jgi:hypothetical protein
MRVVAFCLITSYWLQKYEYFTFLWVHSDFVMLLTSFNKVRFDVFTAVNL